MRNFIGSAEQRDAIITAWKKDIAHHQAVINRLQERILLTEDTVLVKSSQYKPLF